MGQANLFTLLRIGIIVLPLAACSTVRQCPTGQMAVSLVDGELRYEQVMGPCPPRQWMGPNTSGIFAEGHMPAPAPGYEWWN